MLKEMEFPIRKEFTMPVFTDGRKMYVRTRDICFLLGIKQQFQFTADLKAKYGWKCILKGDNAKFITDETGDSKRTTFADLRYVYRYLLSTDSKKHTIPNKKECKDYIKQMIAKQKEQA